MNKKVKFLSVLTTLALTASMGVTAFAASEGTAGGGTGNIGGTVPADNGTEVWAGVAVDAPDMRIKVTVPTLFAFVVNGSIDSAEESTPILKGNGSLLLPNVKVVGGATGSEAAADDTYQIATEGESTLQFENFSTKYNDTTSQYEGLQVELRGSIRNEGSAESRNGWTHVGATPDTTKGEDVKNYHLKVNEIDFESQTDGSFGMSTGVTLAAPDVSNGNLNEETNLAKTGVVVDANFDVEVGGTRGDYKQVEESAKIGTISWEVSAEQTIPNPTPGG